MLAMNVPTALAAAGDCTDAVVRVAVAEQLLADLGRPPGERDFHRQ